MSLELNLYFPDPQHVIVSLIDDNGREETDLLDFTSPLTDKDHQQIRWYLEEYATQYSADIDEQMAGQMTQKLPLWGNALFNKVFSQRAAHRLLKKFIDKQKQGRLLTITASYPAILALPWELLNESGKGDQFLMNESPSISIRRRLVGTNGKSLQINPKRQLHLLFVISRPTKTDLTEPRAHAKAVLDALDNNATSGVTIEFLRPATLKNLYERLENQELPHIDILHFDGHYIFDKEGSLQNKAQAGLNTLPDELKSQAATINLGKNTSYLLFEKDNGTLHPVPALLLADMLNRQQVPLVVLSGYQEQQEDISSVAASMTMIGTRFVLTINALMLASATQAVYGTFYNCLAQGYKVGSALDNARVVLYNNTERREIMRLAGVHQIHLHDWFVPVLYQHGQDTALLTQGLSRPNEETGLAPKTSFLGSNVPNPQGIGFYGRQRELWDIERRFVRGARRMTINGANGQGKTCLAQEAGRWLHRTGLFQRVVFVDFAHYQGLEPISVTISAIATVLQKHLLDVNTTTQALRRVPTLLILANVDSLEQPPHYSHLQSSGENKQAVLEGQSQGQSGNPNTSPIPSSVAESPSLGLPGESQHPGTANILGLPGEGQRESAIATPPGLSGVGQSVEVNSNSYNRGPTLGLETESQREGTMNSLGLNTEVQREETTGQSLGKFIIDEEPDDTPIFGDQGNTNALSFKNMIGTGTKAPETKSQTTVQTPPPALEVQQDNHDIHKINPFAFEDEPEAKVNSVEHQLDNQANTIAPPAEGNGELAKNTPAPNDRGLQRGRF